MAILLSGKIDFKIKNIIRDKEGHYIIIKRSIQEEDITIVNVYAPNIGEVNSNKTIVGDFNIPPSPRDRSSKQRINKGTKALKETLDQMDLVDIFRTFHPNAEEYSFFSSAHGTFSRIDHMLGHKSSLKIM